ncbi:malignant fibrous histiocytoma-amplified sequence 1 homolog [Branchiostoma lanceolatum]|uniref:malignant fibrous histiocytoma-amplified sequence 1 homolog n=1 Tax=Branchiostoma lanceolatum TaxID=7740 RepID=UPI003453E808
MSSKRMVSRSRNLQNQTNLSATDMILERSMGEKSCVEGMKRLIIGNIHHVEEKLFQNQNANWRDAKFCMQHEDWTQVEKLEFPDCSFEWKSLTDGTYSLVMKSKDPPCIPDFLRNDPRTLKVSQLHLSVNRMKKIPDGINIFSEVTDVKLDRNKLKSLTPEFTQLKKIKNLDLGNNIFKTFPAEIKEFSDLEVLRFSVNQVEEIPPGVFPRLPKLKNLRIGSNKLKSLPEDLVSLEKLEYLKISSNKFTTFPPQLLQLPSIRQVCLSANKITEVPLEFFDKPLELFQAEDNPLQKPPQEVCNREKNIEAIKSYCRQIKESLENIVDKRLKLMLLGETGAGKTSLCHSLKAGTSVLAAKDLRTVGIDAHEITEGDVTFLTWDFAGQQDYLVTHPVFITKDALVLLVVNLQKYEPDSDESYRRHVGVWVENIAMRVPNAVVLVVGTHLDKIGQQDADAKLEHILGRIIEDEDDRLGNISLRIAELEEKADRGDVTPEEAETRLEPLREKVDVRLRVWPVGISLSSSEGLLGFDRLKEGLMKIVADQDYFVQVGRTIPRSWKDVETLLVQNQPGGLGDNSLFKQGDVKLSDAVDQILRDTAVRTEDDAKEILRYLHCLGVIIWYDEIDCLKEHVFIDPKRLVDIFKVVVRHGLIDILRKIGPKETKKERIIHKTFELLVDKFDKQALLSHRILKLLWKKADLKLQTRADEKLLVQVLEHFELCFTTSTSQLDPRAPPFDPTGNSPRHSSRVKEVLDDNLYLFPCYLHDEIPPEEWAAECPEHLEQIRVEVKFLPEIPRGSFERLCVRFHKLTPCLQLWRDAAKLRLGGVEILVMKHDNLENPTIEITARSAKDDTGVPRRADLWYLPLQVMRTVSELWTEWPGVIITAFSACPRCKEAKFTVPLPVDTNKKLHKTEPCPSCKEEVPCNLIYPVGR